MPEDTHPGVTSEAAFHREAGRLLARLKTLRDMQDNNPGEPPPGLTDEDLARRMSWDMVAALTRANVVLDMAIGVIEVNTYELSAKNELARADQELARADQGIRLRELARKEQADAEAKVRDEQVRSWIVRCFEAALAFVKSVMSRPEVSYAVAGAIVSAIGVIGMIIMGWLATYGWVPLPVPSP